MKRVSCVGCLLAGVSEAEVDWLEGVDSHRRSKRAVAIPGGGGRPVGNGVATGVEKSPNKGFGCSLVNEGNRPQGGSVLLYSQPGVFYLRLTRRGAGS